MAVGKMPFRGNDENELLWNVCYEQIHYPMFLTKELTELLKLVRIARPTRRAPFTSVWPTRSAHNMTPNAHL